MGALAGNRWGRWMHCADWVVCKAIRLLWLDEGLRVKYPAPSEAS
jgi:hypothetical protein